MTLPIDELIEKLRAEWERTPGYWMLVNEKRRWRIPDLPQPVKFERTIKQPGDIEISTRRVG